MTLRCGGLAVLQPAGRCDRLSAVFRLNCATDNMTWPNRTGGGRGGDNRDYRWSSTPDADRCAVFGTRLGQRPSEPRDLADRLRPAAILQLPDTRRA